MFNLEKVERIAIAILVAALLLAVAIIAYNYLKPASFTVMPFGIESVKEKININDASSQGLERLKGVGKTMAARIIAYRESNGRFSSPEEILKVKGIGESLFKKIKDDITV